MAEEGQQHFPLAQVGQHLGGKEQICWGRKDAECSHMGWVSAHVHERENAFSRSSFSWHCTSSC